MCPESSANESLPFRNERVRNVQSIRSEELSKWKLGAWDLYREHVVPANYGARRASQFTVNSAVPLIGVDRQSVDTPQVDGDGPPFRRLPVPPVPPLNVSRVGTSRRYPSQGPTATPHTVHTALSGGR